MSQRSGQKRQLDDRKWKTGEKERAGKYRGVARSSLYVRMRDGVKLAVDYYLPSNLGHDDRLPAILVQTRYYRRMLLRRPFNLVQGRLAAETARFVKHGYVVVYVDVRGSGASFGSRDVEFSPTEVRDAADIVDWIIDRSWSNGRVGAMGVSYLGTTAEMLLINRHRSVKAVIPRFSMFDAYTDVFAPGGLRNEHFLQVWSGLDEALDQNAAGPFLRRHAGLLQSVALKSVAPVDADADAQVLREAFQQHKANNTVYDTITGIEFRDDMSPFGFTIDQISPHAYADDETASGAPIYSWSGWFDGGYPNAAIKRFLTIKTPGSRLILGPWEHGGGHLMDPNARHGKSRFDATGEMLRYFDHYLKGMPSSIEHEKPVHYYTMGEGAWKESEAWPPPGFNDTVFYFDKNRRLQTEKPEAAEASDVYNVDPSASSGKGTRWVSLVNVGGKRIGYPDRAEQDRRLLVYDSEPLSRAVEVTGHPVVTLFIRASQSDAHFFVYLEDVSPTGEVRYVTEGWFRAIHRKAQPVPHPHGVPVPYHSFLRGDAMPLVPGEVAEVAFDLQPVSYLFQAGHVLRIAIAGADRDQAEPLSQEPVQIELLRSAEYPSGICLPVQYRTDETVVQGA